MSDRERLSQLIQASGRVAIFTGAGISTESGIPDFRSPGGVWSRMQPIRYGEFMGSEAKRREAWTRTFSGVAGWVGMRPNAGHYGVARLVASGKARVVITQNVDNLHQATGMPADRLIELHGNASYATCLDCGLRHELEALRLRFDEAGEIPMCRECGGVVKTAVISFGQALPAEALARAEAESRACDLMLVLGSSLQVHPAAGLPLTAKRSGARLAIVNNDPTPQDEIAYLVLHEPIGEVMDEVAPHLWGVSAAQ